MMQIFPPTWLAASDDNMTALNSRYAQSKIFLVFFICDIFFNNHTAHFEMFFELYIHKGLRFNAFNFNISNQHRMWTQNRLWTLLKPATNYIENRYRMMKSSKIRSSFKIPNDILMKFMQELWLEQWAIIRVCVFFNRN